MSRQAPGDTFNHKTLALVQSATVTFERALVRDNLPYAREDLFVHLCDGCLCVLFSLILHERKAAETSLNSDDSADSAKLVRQ